LPSSANIISGQGTRVFMRFTFVWVSRVGLSDNVWTRNLKKLPPRRIIINSYVRTAEIACRRLSSNNIRYDHHKYYDATTVAVSRCSDWRPTECASSTTKTLLNYFVFVFHHRNEKKNGKNTVTL
jgi:hypothetical protein